MTAAAKTTTTVEECDDEWGAYVFGRRLDRVAGNAAAAACVLPFLRGRLLPRQLRPRLLLVSPFSATSASIPSFSLGSLRDVLSPSSWLLRLWLPAHPVAAALVGGCAGLLEDRHARMAYDETLTAGDATEPLLWTARTLLPALAAFISPWVAFKALDGELKGGNAALAKTERRPLQVWPFFAVLDPTRPSSAAVASRYLAFDDGKGQEKRASSEAESPAATAAAATAGHLPCGSFTSALTWHLLWCRWLSPGGFYEMNRNPANARWDIWTWGTDP